ncbi:hypothetical protein [Sphingobacterium allocomposti]|uniref:hypothetical protein n=1 Tax=Sphingobacterium allocomposti TaxID=415956 RepID=UPI0014790215|nr:hypothetical protein [Sphingobacterium composti Yoo et al. 2007 non Ten et al. 2007]
MGEELSYPEKSPMCQLHEEYPDKKANVRLTKRIEQYQGARYRISNPKSGLRKF